MRYAHIISRIKSTAWLATPEAVEAVVETLNQRIAGGPRAFFDMDDDEGEREEAPLYTIEDGTAIIGVHGIIGKRLSVMETMCGGVDVDTVRVAYDAAMADPAVSSVLLDIGSPGGAVTGVPELSAHMVATKTKPVLAYTDTLMASGGYYLAIAADAIAASETSDVGCIGVIMRVVNQSDALKAEGLAVRTFKSGAHKDIYSPYRDMTEEEAAMTQASVDELGAKFRADIKAQRPLAQDGGMTGLTYGAHAGIALGLVDYVANTRADALKLLKA